MIMSEKKDYLGMFNVLKGILMLIVVWVHHEFFARDVIFSGAIKFPPVFRWSAGIMAVFFVVAGYQYRPARNMKVYIKNQLLSNLVPYWIVVAVSAAFLFIWHILKPESVHLWDIRMLLLGSIYGTDHNLEFMGIWFGGVVALWFLPVYCMSGILYQCIQRMHERKFRMLAVWGLTLIGVSMPDNTKITIPFFTVQICTTLGFWEIGRILKEKKILYRKLPLPFVLGSLFLVTGCYMFSVSNMASNVWKFWVVDYAAAAIFSVLVLRGYVRSGLGTARGTAILEYTGMYSMIFYCVHCVDLLVVPWDRRLIPIIPFAGDQRILVNVVQMLVFYILRVSVLLAVTALINDVMKKIYRFRVKKKQIRKVQDYEKK